MRPAEKILLGLLLERSDLLDRARGLIKPEDFQHPVVRRIVEKLFAIGEMPPVSGWMNLFQQETGSDEILALAVSEAERVPEKEKAFEDCLSWIERARLESRRETLRSEIEEAHRAGDQNRIHRLLLDFTELNKGMKKIYEKSE